MEYIMKLVMEIFDKYLDLQMRTEVSTILPIILKTTGSNFIFDNARINSMCIHFGTLFLWQQADKFERREFCQEFRGC